MNRSQLLISVMAVSACGPFAFGIAPRTITVEEARELAKAAVLPDNRTARGFGFEYSTNPYFPEFYFFQAIWDSPAETSFNLGHYAVDQKTGDVWDGVVCREHKSRELKQLQASIRKRIGLTHEHYKRIRRKGPMCN